jgi:hypothetical protein
MSQSRINTVKSLINEAANFMHELTRWTLENNYRFGSQAASSEIQVSVTDFGAFQKFAMIDNTGDHFETTDMVQAIEALAVGMSY